MAGLPAALRPGDELRLGEAVVELGGDGVLRACDPHGCVEADVSRGVRVVATPAPATGRLLRVRCIYVEFQRPVYAERGDTIWFHAPIEVEVRAGRVLVARLSPTRVKYTLVGDVIDGTICRYHKSPAGIGEPPGAPPEGCALAAARVAGDPGLHPGAALEDEASLYRARDGTLYYSLHEVSVDSGIATSRSTTRPPRAGLSLAWRPAGRAVRLSQAITQVTYRIAG